jgi:hypothetical protein
VDPRPGILAEPATLNRFTYATDSPTNHTDPTGEAQCLYGDCSLRQTPTGHIIVADVDDSPLYALMARISQGDASAAEALGAQLDATWSWGQPLPELHFSGLAARLGDHGFAPELADNHLYCELWKVDQCKNGERNLSTQLGHFLTGVDMGYGDAIGRYGPLLRSRRLPLIVGHEMAADQGGVVGRITSTRDQYRKATPLDVSRFLRAVALDEAGDCQARDAELYAIYDPARNGPQEARLGNSMEDLRLSVRGWRLGHLVASGELETNKDLVDWIALYVAGG